MGKKLSEMSLEELWQLFPIILTEHRECWKLWYAEEEAALREAVPQAERISHIGSTAVGSIWAKPIVDILVEVPAGCALEDLKAPLLANGYLCMSEDGERASFNKGYTEHGFAERVFHLHLRYAGDHDELYFRDYLVDHPDIAADYEKLKLRLWKEYEHDRDGYTGAKTAFVRSCTAKAAPVYAYKYRGAFT